MKSIWSEKDYDTFFEACGGKQNILQVENCVTRLRVLLMNCSFDKEALTSLPGVKMVMERRNELQLVIGLDVFNIEKNCLDKLK